MKLVKHVIQNNTDLVRGISSIPIDTVSASELNSGKSVKKDLFQLTNKDVANFSDYFNIKVMVTDKNFDGILLLSNNKLVVYKDGVIKPGYVKKYLRSIFIGDEDPYSYLSNILITAFESQTNNLKELLKDKLNFDINVAVIRPKTIKTSKLLNHLSRRL